MSRDLDTLTGLIYLELFGLTRRQMLTLAKEHPHYEAIDSDEDENMRDCLSVEALTALNDVEGAMAYWLKTVDLLGTLTPREKVKRISQEIMSYCEAYLSRHGGKIEPIWYEGKSNEQRI